MAMLCALSATAAAWTAPHHAALRARPPMMAMSRTEEIMKSLPEERQSGGAGGQSTYEGLLRLDAGWEALRSGSPPKAVRKIVVEEPNSAAATPEFDVVVCGGTIGVIVAAALQAKGLKVALVEAGKLCGRNQDWNASRKEVLELVELGVITKEDLERVIGIEFNPMRCGFPGGDDVWLADVLNVGVRPDELVGAARRSLEANGGSVFEESPLEVVAVRPGAAVLRLGSSRSSEDGATKTEIRTKLVLDCMGQRSPIVAQVREGQRPDGVCVVVGSCARGYDADANSFGDVIFADTLTEPAGGSGCPTQYFWEAFPASSGPADRTTYLFAYMDLDPQRPSVTDIMEDYWRLLPGYQGVTIDELELQRVLYGLFVSYKDSPLPTKFDRVLQVGDASGIQSPLSFGGFGAITRHLGRLTTAIPAALAADALTASELSLINLYQPNLRAAWLFQATMRPPIGADGGMVWRDTFIGAVLAGTFDVMEKEGESVMKVRRPPRNSRPFLACTAPRSCNNRAIGALWILSCSLSCRTCFASTGSSSLLAD